MNEVTQLLEAAQRGEKQAAADLLPLVYEELRRLANQKLAHENPGQTLQATALVHEAYLRLVGQDDERKWDNRGHFFAAAAEAMRRILVEAARRKHTLKRGGDRQQQTVDDFAAPEPDEKLLALDEALHKLAELDPEKAKLVELRYFAALTSEQAAKVLDISKATADRHWSFARAWLQAAMGGS